MNYPSRNDWMTRLPDEFQISWLSIPATHDSAAWDPESSDVIGSAFNLLGLGPAAIARQLIEYGARAQGADIREQLRVGLEEHVVDADDLRHERKVARQVLRVEDVQAVQELEGRHDEGQAQLGRTPEGPAVDSRDEPAGGAGFEAEDTNLVRGVDDTGEGAQELDEIRPDSLGLAVQVVGLDPDAHENC